MDEFGYEDTKTFGFNDDTRYHLQVGQVYTDERDRYTGFDTSGLGAVLGCAPSRHMPNPLKDAINKAKQDPLINIKDAHTLIPELPELSNRKSKKKKKKKKSKMEKKKRSKMDKKSKKRKRSASRSRSNSSSSDSDAEPKTSEEVRLVHEKYLESLRQERLLRTAGPDCVSPSSVPTELEMRVKALVSLINARSATLNSLSQSPSLPTDHSILPTHPSIIPTHSSIIPTHPSIIPTHPVIPASINPVTLADRISLTDSAVFPDPNSASSGASAAALEASQRARRLAEELSRKSSFHQDSSPGVSSPAAATTDASQRAHRLAQEFRRVSNFQ